MMKTEMKTPLVDWLICEHIEWIPYKINVEPSLYVNVQDISCVSLYRHFVKRQMTPSTLINTNLQRLMNMIMGVDSRGS